MATRGQKKRRPNAQVRKVVGTFTLFGTEEQTRLTISQGLEAEGFPVEPGNQVQVEVVCPDEGDSFLEVRPLTDERGG